MLRLIHYGNALPMSFICDPSAEFQAGQVAGLTIVGNQVMATVSDGTCPIGIIDDMRTRSFTRPSWNEVVIVASSGIPNGNGRLVTPIDIKQELKFANVVASSFTSSIPVILNTVNGVITIPSGTELNIDLDGDGTPNAVRVICNYTYQVPDVPGDDSTDGSGRITVWYERMFIETDQYVTNVSYPLRANLYVNESGLFTTAKPAEGFSAVAIVTAPPSIVSPFLQLLWL